MSRSGYSEDCENLNLWRGAVERAIKGKRGQAFLRELAEALDAMPVAALIADELVNSAGEVCAIGAVCKKRGIDTAPIDYDDPRSVGNAVGIAYALAAEIEYLNDEGRYAESPRERWFAMREWVGNQIIPSR